jgi:hypothetical protein
MSSLILLVLLIVGVPPLLWGTVMLIDLLALIGGLLLDRLAGRRDG